MNRLPALVLALSLVVAATTIIATIGLLPPLVPSHIAINGRSDRVSPRDVYVAVMLGVAVGLPLLMVASMGSVRRIPPRFVNLPNRDYWLAPERRERAYATLRAFACLVGSLVALFTLALHLLIVTGELTQGRAPSPLFFVLLGAFVVVLLTLIAGLVRAFARPRR